jgi:UDP:flavonoid glycosyltransferase YjiC (YdhE family)
MSKILFVTWPGGGNQPPAIGLAQQLHRDGHETVFAGYIDQAKRFTLLDLEFAQLTRSGTTWESFNTADLMPLLIKHAWACPDHVADTAEILDRFQPDLVVVDCLMGGVLAAMETSYVPTIALVHSAPGALAPPGGPIDRFVIGEVNRIRFALDLTPVNSYWQAWQQHDVICASIPELDPLGTDTLHPVAWIGPVFEDLTTIDWMPDDHDDTPLVLVSFNSEGAWDQTSRIQGTIDGLAGADLRVIVTAGAVDPSRLHVPTKSIEIVKYVPHAAILPWASAVVTHAGHGTLTAALAHGLPIVAIPNEAADQPALAAQTARLGAGIHLHEEGATATAIASAIRTVLDDSTYAANARALGDRIHTYSNQPRAVVERILGHASTGQLTATGESSSSQSTGPQIDRSQ